MYPFDNHFLSPIGSPPEASEAYAYPCSPQSQSPAEQTPLCLPPEKLHIFNESSDQDLFTAQSAKSLSTCDSVFQPLFDTGNAIQSPSVDSLTTTQHILAYHPDVTFSNVQTSNNGPTSVAHARIHHSRDVANYQQLSQRICELLPQPSPSFCSQSRSQTHTEKTLTTCRTPSSQAWLEQLEKEVHDLLGASSKPKPVTDLTTLSGATLNQIWERGTDHYLAFLQSLEEAKPILFRTPKHCKTPCSALNLASLRARQSLFSRTGNQLKDSRLYRYLTKRHIVRLQPLTALAVLCLQRQDHTNLTRILSAYPEVIDTLLAHRELFSAGVIFVDANLWPLLAQSVALVHLHPEKFEHYLPHLSMALVSYFETNAQTVESPKDPVSCAHPFSSMAQFCQGKPSRHIVRFEQNLGRCWQHLFPDKLPVFDLLSHTDYRESLDRSTCVYLTCILAHACDKYMSHLGETGLKSALRMFFHTALPSMLREGLFVFGQKSLTTSQMHVLQPTDDALPQKAAEAAAFQEELIGLYPSLKFSEFRQMGQAVVLRRQKAGQRASSLLSSMYERYLEPDNTST